MARMKLRVLGVHNMESEATRLAGYLIDDVLALDAGSISRSLTFEEQRRIGAVLITHEHNDHVRDLPALRQSVAAAGASFDVYALSETLESIVGRYIPGPVPGRAGSPGDVPTPRPVSEGETFCIGRHSVRPFRMRHSVPCAGYDVSDGSACLFYTGDTGPGLEDVWRQVEPDALLTEVTYGNDNQEAAVRLGHLTPRLLEAELGAFREARGYLPKVIVTHISPPWEAAVRSEIASLAGGLEAEVIVATAGETLEIRPARG